MNNCKTEFFVCEIGGGDRGLLGLKKVLGFKDGRVRLRGCKADVVLHTTPKKRHSPAPPTKAARRGEPPAALHLQEALPLGGDAREQPMRPAHWSAGKACSVSNFVV